MRLARLGPAGDEVPVALTRDGAARDLSGHVHDITPALLDPAALAELAAVLAADPERFPRLDPRGRRMGPPVAGIGKIVCVGLNYRAHAAEAGQEPPAEPVLFLKAADTVVGPCDDVGIPPGSTRTDYEVELAVVIGREADLLADDEDPLDRVAGYTVSNDVSEREYQFDRGGQWDKGKNCPTFNPLGPVLVTRDEIADPQALELRSSVNGRNRQLSSTSDMIFPVEELVRYVSRFMTLHPGDVLNTGTPAGVGAGLSPPRYLQDGDVVELAVAGIGTMRQTFRRRTPGRR